MDPFCVLDIETTGTRPGCAVIAIAALFHSAATAHPPSDCYIARLGLAQSARLGLHSDTDTLAWWHGDYDRRNIFADLAMHEDSSIGGALLEIASLMQKHRCRQVWCRGPHFDIPILEAAARAAGIDTMPWEYWQIRDIRTAQDYSGRARSKKSHRPLDDCRDDLPIVLDYLQACELRRDGEP